MKKWQRIVSIVFVVFVLSCSVVVWAFSDKGFNSGGDVIVSYDKARNDKIPFVVMFHSPWCGYCKRFEPFYKDLATLYKGKYNFTMVDGEMPENIMLVRDFAIGGYPTLYIVDPTIDNRICLSNTIYGDFDKLKAELDRYLRIRAMIN